jgi:hypothetical protein
MFITIARRMHEIKDLLMRAKRKAGMSSCLLNDAYLKQLITIVVVTIHSSHLGRGDC